MEERDATIFGKKYHLLASTASYQYHEETPRVCRFCKRGHHETTFNKKAHVLPELMGKNNYLSSEECDDCNGRFSAFESHLATYFRPYLTMAGVEGKHGIPQFHSRTIDADENTRLKAKMGEDSKRYIEFGNLDDYKVDKERKTASITFRIPPHRPKFIYKALTRIALSLLPKEKTEQYRNLFAWLLDKGTAGDHFHVAVETLLPGQMFGTPYADLFEAVQVQEEDVFNPELTLVVGFANIVVQIFLPLSHKFDYPASNGKAPSIHVYPAFHYSIIKENDTVIGMTPTSSELREYQLEETTTFDRIINFSFASYEGEIYPD